MNLQNLSQKPSGFCDLRSRNVQLTENSALLPNCLLDDVLFDTHLRWVEKSGQAPHWTTFVLDAGVLTFTVRAADKTPPKVECRPTLKHWRCGGNLCSICPVPLLIKDTKTHCIFSCSALFACRN